MWVWYLKDHLSHFLLAEQVTYSNMEGKKNRVKTIFKSLKNIIEELKITFLKESHTEDHFIVLKMLSKKRKRESARDLTYT